MFNLSISFGPAGGMFVLVFKTAEAAEAAYAKVRNPGVIAPGAVVEISDNFGHNVRIALSQIHGAMIEDVDAALKLRADRWVAEQKAQAKAMQSVQNDPQMKAMAMLGPGGMPINSFGPS